MKSLTLGMRNFKEIYRDPISVSLGLALPVLLLGLYAFINSRVAQAVDIFSPLFITPAVICFGFAFIIMFLATLVTRDRSSAFVARLLSTPAGATDFIVGYILPFLPFALGQIAVCYAFGSLLGASIGLWSISALLFFMPLALMSACIGVAIGSICTEGQVAGAGPILINLIGISSGAFLDLSMIGGTGERIARAMPYALTIDATRALAGGESLASQLPRLGWVCAYTAAFVALAALAFAWKTRRR